eukprot:Phypoly_transcript_11736.p1 GENE.Phypoly_transcript_11736~~Phypoly_transcript_11736.p1  ORF type:complete len:370 (+),score=81.55 Phypoly_transcript_11736:119-1111(+)
MAHVYTTSRGKTKKAKESQRKDAKNNAANKLMTNISKPGRASAYVAPNMDFINKLSADVNGMKTLEGSSKSKLFKRPVSADDSSSLSDETIDRAIRNVRVQLPSYHRCFYSLCATPENSTYKHCGRCKIARYCSVECQKADWPLGHKAACGKPESLAIGSSVAIRPLETYLSLLPPSLYPSETCRAPCNELHGVVIAIHPPPSDPPTPPTEVEVEIFDSHIIPSDVRIRVAAGDAVVSGWELEGERGMAEEKRRGIAEARKREADRKAMLEEEERVYQEKQRKKAQRVKALVEKKKQELENASGNVGVDWSLFESELMEEDLDELDEDDQ